MQKQIKDSTKNERSDSQKEVKKLYKYKIPSDRDHGLQPTHINQLPRTTPTLPQDKDVPEDDSEPFTTDGTFIPCV